MTLRASAGPIVFVLLAGTLAACTTNGASQQTVRDDSPSAANADSDVTAAPGTTGNSASMGLAAAAASAGQRPRPAPAVVPLTSALRANQSKALGPLTPLRLTPQGSPSTATGTAAPAPAPDSSSINNDPSPAGSAGLIRDTRPWRLGESKGQAVLTDHFVVYTTEKSPIIAQAMPGFMEAALTHYRRFITPLPPPRDVMDTYVLADRAQWQTLARMLMDGPQAESASSLQRGGLTYRAKALLFDMGPADTLAIAAHEGWHQYTQVTFRQPLPVWLEESLATLAEGHAWAGPEPVFLPWANPARFDRLREAFERNELLSIQQIIEGTPASMLGAAPATTSANVPASSPSITRTTSRNALRTNAQDRAAAWYSHVWALGLFLKEHAGDEARRGLARAINDANAGTVGATLATELKLDPDRATRAMLGPQAAALHFRVYFAADPRAGATLDRDFQLFVAQLVRPGARSIITQGKSPIIPPDPTSTPPAPSPAATPPLVGTANPLPPN